MVHCGSRFTRSPLLYSAYSLAILEYTFSWLSKHVPLFLSYKMIVRDLLGCTGRWGFCGIFKHFSGFEFFSASKQSPRPPQRQ